MPNRKQLYSFDFRLAPSHSSHRPVTQSIRGEKIGGGGEGPPAGTNVISLEQKRPRMRLKHCRVSAGLKMVSGKTVQTRGCHGPQNGLQVALSMLATPDGTNSTSGSATSLNSKWMLQRQSGICHCNPFSMTTTVPLLEYLDTSGQTTEAEWAQISTTALLSRITPSKCQNGARKVKSYPATNPREKEEREKEKEREGGQEREKERGHFSRFYGR